MATGLFHISIKGMTKGNSLKLQREAPSSQREMPINPLSSSRGADTQIGAIPSDQVSMCGIS